MDTKIFLVILAMRTSMPVPPPVSTDDLGLQGCLYLWGLLISRDRRLLVTPTRRFTLGAMKVLQEQGVIEVPWPDAHWGARPDAEQTPMEGLQWKLAWHVYEPSQLVTALEDYLGAVDRDEFGMALRLRLWVEIGSAETERFFEQQLVRHGFRSEWAQDVGFVLRECKANLTLAQWRYCAWAAVRRGASLAMQQSSSEHTVREVIYRELGQRAAAISSGMWTRCSLPPFQPKPESAVALGFTRHLSRLGALYWSAPQSIESLLAAEGSQPR